MSAAHQLQQVDALRIRAANERQPARGAEYVLYWMIAARRGAWNFALQHAVSYASELGLPLVVLEALRCDYRWASDRLHRFVLDGMRDNRRWFAARGIAYHAYVEPERGAGKGLLAALAKRAAVVVTDEFPCFFLPRMIDAAARELPTRLEAVDTNGLLPVRAAASDYPTAYAFRRFLHKHLPPHLARMPLADPLDGVALPKHAEIPSAITRRWPSASAALLDGGVGELRALPIDHRVAPTEQRGGPDAAARALKLFVERKLVDYEQRNAPDADVTSHMSPYLHFGHISAHALFSEIMAREDWTPARLSSVANGRREGWWNVSANVEGFLDQLVTWRELGINCASFRADYERFDALPQWALATLGAHAGDKREHVYSLAELDAARTFDPLWNAAQTQLAREGRIHNYMRMLWGKKVLEWSRTPGEALAALIELNNRYALDGRDPNSYSGIFWCFGRFDRPWPERKIFGTVRYMSSDNTARKHDVEEYVRRYSRARAASETSFD